MSEIHNSDIRELLDAIPVIPNELMAEYLTRQYQVSKNMAQEIIYNACRKGSNRRPGLLSYQRRVGESRLHHDDEQHPQALPCFPRCM